MIAPACHRESTSPVKHAVKSSIMPLASRRLERETACTIVNQQRYKPSLPRRSLAKMRSAVRR
jgi:hypothetical protein